MLITSVLASLGGCTTRCGPPPVGQRPGGGAANTAGGAGSSKDGSSSNPNVLAPAEGYQLLLQCDAVKGAHWAFRLYLARCERCTSVVGSTLSWVACSFHGGDGTWEGASRPTVHLLHWPLCAALDDFADCLRDQRLKPLCAYPYPSFSIHLHPHRLCYQMGLASCCVLHMPVYTHTLSLSLTKLSCSVHIHALPLFMSTGCATRWAWPARGRT